MGKRRGSHPRVTKITSQRKLPPWTRPEHVQCADVYWGSCLKRRMAAFLVIAASTFLPCIFANAETSQPGFVYSAELPVIARPFYAEPVVVQPPTTPASHPFWDRRNRLLFAGIGVFRALDYASTRNMQARGREEILLPDEVANNNQGFAALEAAGTASSIALSYWMHRTGHHSAERWISIVHIGVTGFGAVRNYCLESKRPVAFRRTAR
jgi:hypothetical protein